MKKGIFIYTRGIYEEARKSKPPRFCFHPVGKREYFENSQSDHCKFLMIKIYRNTLVSSFIVLVGKEKKRSEHNE